MQSLLVEALALRQLGRLNPRQLLAPAYGFKQTTWPVVRGRDAVRIWSLHQLRFKSSKKKGLTKVLEEENELDTDDSDSEDEKEEEDPNLPKDYKDLEKFVATYRYDAFFKYGTDMARNKIEDAFYKNKLRLNGQKLLKKSKLVKVGDTLDLVLSESIDKKTVTLMRVVFKKILEETDSERDTDRVALRRWKRLELPKDEAFKP
ncbi:hypothetical protein CRUP_037395 [Coryphaenoides rupestris]|nr:hypothetical protein CRUP_037395 [Coryphaenoides rupestris]